MAEELLKNDIIEVTVDNLGMNGEGVARAGGKAVFIRGALTGEHVRAKIIAVKPRFDIALLEKVISPSPDRVTPVCPLFGKCGGCDLQHLSYAAELEFKRKLVTETLFKAGGIDFPADFVVPSDTELRYRNKISLPVRFVQGRTQIGLFAKNSHRVVETDDCLLQQDWTEPLIAALRSFMAENGYSGYDEENHRGDIRHLVARFAGGKLIATIVALKKINCEAFYDALCAICGNCELWLNVNTRRNNVILGDEWICIRRGGDAVVDGLKADLHPAGFYQVNDGVREKLYDYVATLCEGGAAVEAYSGAGLLSARLAEYAAVVYGIEINAHAHASAVKLADDNGLRTFHPVCGDVGEKLAGVLKSATEHAGANKNTFVVLDPPRTGISDEAADTLLSSGAKNIVYVSCNPATLARDAAKLIAGGYNVRSVKPFDMFPRTANVETVMHLAK